MPIKLKISPRILPNISTLYNDSSRVIMEFIDNSLDSAENYFDVTKNRYIKPLTIAVSVKGSTYRDGKVIINDNCAGIDHISKIIESIGSSDKKAQGWTNGQFGFGIYSFMAICDEIKICSKEVLGEAYSIVINKKQLDTSGDVIFPDPKFVKRFNSESGTEVALGDFDKHCWKQVTSDLNILKNEIESHFELLLKRENLKIIIIDQKKTEHVCRFFDYEQYEGDYYEDNITDLQLTKGRKYKTVTTIPLKKPIHVFIKITKGNTINKNPVFIAKGRRIGEIGDIRSFRSSHKSDLWGHPNVTGFIDTGDYLKPTIARNDFKNDDHTRALFNKLIEIEDLIIDVVKKANKESEERHFKELENKLNKALSKLAKMDLMNFRTNFITGNEINLQSGGTGQELGGEGGKDRGNGKGGNGPSIGGENEGDDLGVTGNEGTIPGGDDGGVSAKNKENDNPFDDSEFKGSPKKKSGFNIRIVDSEPDIDSESNLPLRSKVIGGDIVIFKKHLDFQSRVSNSHTKQKKITQRLTSYLAGEITVHYKDRFYCKSGQPDYNKRLFIGLVEFIYQFEDMLKDLVGKNLSDMN